MLFIIIYKTDPRALDSVHQSVTLTCLFVFLLVWPDDRAETGKDQRAKPAGSFLRSTVIVQGILAQHKPVPPLLDPVPSHLQ